MGKDRGEYWKASCSAKREEAKKSELYVRLDHKGGERDLY